MEEKALSPPASALRHLTVAQQCREVHVRAAEDDEKTCMKRMPASTIRVQYNSGTDDPETDVDMLTTLVEEKGRCDLACGTKRALVGGGRGAERPLGAVAVRSTAGASRGLLDLDSAAGYLEETEGWIQNVPMRTGM